MIVGHFISVGADERAPHLVDGAIKDFEYRCNKADRSASGARRWSERERISHKTSVTDPARRSDLSLSTVTPDVTLCGIPEEFDLAKLLI